MSSRWGTSTGKREVAVSKHWSRLRSPCLSVLVCVLWSYLLAVGGAVDAAGAEQVEAARRVEAAAALPAVTQAVVIVFHQRLSGPQHTSLA